MKIVIDISDDEYEDVKKIGGCYYDFGKAIYYGTLLPKGNRRLIAEPTEEDIAKTVGGQNDFAECIRDAVRMVFINAPTIIEVDKAESEVNVC